MITQEEILKQYFMNNPNRDIPHPEIVDYVTEKFKNETGKVFRDPDRGIRKLHQSGFLIKVKKGTYRYDPDSIHNKNYEDFSTDIKVKILERDGFRCVVCNKGKEDGVELHVDHIRAKDLGGKADFKNGQTLCSRHNFLKKNLNQTTFAKKLFIKLYAEAKYLNDIDLINFCLEVLNIYEKYNIDNQIIFRK